MRLRITLVVMSLLLAGCAGPPKHATWGNATGGEQHEQLMWKAIHDKDWTAVERRLSPTFVGVNAGGQMFDRAGWLGYWKSAQPAEISLGDLAVQPEGVDMKVTGILHLQGGADTAFGPGGFRVISIWQQVKNNWMLTATSMTPLQNGQ
jgi:hypothetical protein